MGTKHLYFITTLDDRSKLKVGISSHPISRLKQLQTGTDQTLLFIYCALIKDAERVESAIHLLWEDYRIRGEWFKDIPENKKWPVIHMLWSMDLDCGCNACTQKVNHAILQIV